MQQPTTQAPAAPAPPAAPVATTPGEVPTSRAQLEGMAAKRGELTNQLETLTDRREELVEQRAAMGTEERRGHDARIQVIDQRSAQIERELLATDDAIAKALSSGVTFSGQQQGEVRTTTTAELTRAVRNEVEDSIFGALAGGAFAFFSMYVLWRGFRRFIWKRKPPAAAIAAPDPNPRLDQLQQSIDVIALEVERISEAQRFVAKVLNEKIPALGAGAAQPVSSRARDEVRNER